MVEVAFMIDLSVEEVEAAIGVVEEGVGTEEEEPHRNMMSLRKPIQVHVYIFCDSCVCSTFVDVVKWCMT